MMYRKISIFVLAIILVGVCTSCKKDEAVQGAGSNSYWDDYLNPGDGEDGEGGTLTVCGNGECEAGETEETCSEDCSESGGGGDPGTKTTTTRGPKIRINSTITVNEFEKKSIELRLVNYTGQKEWDYEMAETDGITVVLNDDNDTIDITGNVVGDYPLTLIVRDAANTSNEVARKEITVKVAANPLVIVSPTSLPAVIISDGNTPTLIDLTAGGGSGAYSWAVSCAECGVDNLAISVAENKMSITPKQVGNYNIKLVLTDSGTARTAEIVLPLTVNENIASNSYVVDITAGTAALIAAQIEGDPVTAEGKDIEEGHAIAIFVQGQEDNYTCEIKRAECGDKGGLVVENVTGINIDGKGKLVCIASLTLNEGETLGPDGVTCSNVDIDVKGGFSTDSTESSLPVFAQLRFMPNPCKAPLKIEVVKAKSGPSDTALLDYQLNMEDPNDITLGMKFKTLLQVTGGKPPYKWYFKGNLFGKAAGQTEYLMSNTTENEEWEPMDVLDSDKLSGFIDPIPSQEELDSRRFLKFEGEFRYDGDIPVEGLEADEDPQEIITVAVSDSCDSGVIANRDNSQIDNGLAWGWKSSDAGENQCLRELKNQCGVQKITFNVKYPGADTEDSLSVNMTDVKDVWDTWDDGSSWLKIIIMKGGAGVDSYKYNLDDCGDNGPDKNCRGRHYFTNISSKKYKITEINQIRFKFHDGGVDGWFDGASGGDLDCDVRHVQFCGKYWCAYFNDDGSGGDQMNDDIVSPGGEKNFDVMSTIMEQAGVSNPSDIWQRRKRPEY